MPHPEVNVRFAWKWELPANILEGRKLLSSKKFVSLPIPCASLALLGLPTSGL